MRTIVVLDAPSNLGLRPPAPGTVPAATSWPARCGSSGSCSGSARWRAGSWCRRATTAGTGRRATASSTPPPSPRTPRKLADRIERHVRAGEFPVVLGGDCSIQLGASLALRRLGRYGLAAVDGSADFRHPGNSDRVGAAGGEELALATGRGQADLTDLEGLGPT